MSQDTEGGQRWSLRNSNGAISVNHEIRFLAQIGEYDVFYDATNKCYTVARERPIGGSRRHNFTDYYLDGENLEPCDYDVELDPYHMCLLYQLHEEVGHTLVL
jgi:hypothetical protein